MKCGWCLTEAVDEGGRCGECGAQQNHPGVWHIPRREREYDARYDVSFQRGAAVAFGLLAMGQAIAEAIDTRCWDCRGILGHFSWCFWYGEHDCNKHGCSFAHGPECLYCGADGENIPAKDGTYQEWRMARRAMPSRSDAKT